MYVGGQKLKSTMSLLNGHNELCRTINNDCIFNHPARTYFKYNPTRSFKTQKMHCDCIGHLPNALVFKTAWCSQDMDKDNQVY